MSYINDAGWKIYRIAEVISDLKSGFSHSKTKLVENGIPQLRPYNISTSFRLDLSKLVYVPEDRPKTEEFFLKRDDILFNNTNSVELVGKTAIVKKDLDAGYSNHITRIRVIPSLIEPHWLALCLQRHWLAGKFAGLCKRWIGQAGISGNMLKELEIPVPSLEIQKSMIRNVDNYSKKLEKISNLRKVTNKETEMIMQSALHEVFSNAEKKGWKLQKLEDISNINPSKTEIKNLPNDLDISFIPMESVSDEMGEIQSGRIRKLGEVRKGYTYFKENDVLFAKITPCMENGKSAVAKKLTNGIGLGSTEFHVIRTKSDVIPEWIYHFIRQKSFRVEAETSMTGTAGQKRVPEIFLKNVKVPIPNVKTQKSLISYLHEMQRKLETISKLQNEIQRSLKTIHASIIYQAFRGDLL